MLYFTEISTRAQQKNALRYLVILLPRPNRDTLQELLQFLCKVALHSDGIILVDGTEVSNKVLYYQTAIVL